MEALESDFPVAATNENCAPVISGLGIAVAHHAGHCIALRTADA